jgi:hypothetical protein
MKNRRFSSVQIKKLIQIMTISKISINQVDLLSKQTTITTIETHFL